MYMSILLVAFLYLLNPNIFGNGIWIKYQLFRTRSQNIAKVTNVLHVFYFHEDRSPSYLTSCSCHYLCPTHLLNLGN